MWEITNLGTDTMDAIGGDCHLSLSADPTLGSYQFDIWEGNIHRDTFVTIKSGTVDQLIDFSKYLEQELGATIVVRGKVEGIRRDELGLVVNALDPDGNGFTTLFPPKRSSTIHAM